MNNVPVNPYNGYVPNQAMGNIKNNNSLSEKTVDFTKKDCIFYVLFAVAALCTVFFGLFGGMAAGFAVSSVGLAVLMIVYLFNKKQMWIVPGVSAAVTVLNFLVFFLYGDDFATRDLAFFMIILSGIVFTVTMRDKSCWTALTVSAICGYCRTLSQCFSPTPLTCKG